MPSPSSGAQSQGGPETQWHGYVLLRKPPALSDVDWGICVAALRQVLARRPGSSHAEWRMHWRLSLDGRKVIMESLFDLADLDPQDLVRFCKYVSDALDGRLTPGQVRAAFGGYVAVFAAGEAWRRSNSAAHSYMAQTLAEWEVVE